MESGLLGTEDLSYYCGEMYIQRKYDQQLKDYLMYEIFTY